MTPTLFKDQILELAKEGVTPTKIAKQLNLNPVSVTSFLYKKGFSYGRGVGNNRYFQHIDQPEKAYILGFIAADGYIVQSTKFSITLGIQINKEDCSVLEFIRNQLGVVRKLTYPNSKMVRFTFSNKELVQDLYNLGITQRKSLTLINILKNIPEQFHTDFIAGYFDGDGCVFKINNSVTKFRKRTNEFVTYKQIGSTISIRGTKELLTAFIKPLHLTHYQSFHDGKTWNLRFSKHTEVYKFYHFYKKSPFKLSRKFNKLEAGINLILSKYPKVQTISSSLP